MPVVTYTIHQKAYTYNLKKNVSKLAPSLVISESFIICCCNFLATDQWKIVAIHFIQMCALQTIFIAHSWRPVVVWYFKYILWFFVSVYVILGALGKWGKLWCVSAMLWPPPRCTFNWFTHQDMPYPAYDVLDILLIQSRSEVQIL